MLCFCVVLFFAHTSWSALVSDEQNRNGIQNRVNSYELPHHHPRDDRTARTTVKQEQPEEDENATVSWKNFTLTLTEATLEQIGNVRENIKISYRLSPSDIQEIDKAFKEAPNDYLQLIKHNLKKLIDAGEFNNTIDFMVDFADLSSFVLERTLESTLADVGGALLSPTKWYKQSMKQKILRQQTKIATNYVESLLCQKLEVCKDRVSYTQYLSEWVRLFLGFSPSNLKILFLVIPDILVQNMNTIKSTHKFMKTVKYLVNSNDIVQRDTLDYIDEVITSENTVNNLLPSTMKKGAALLKELFQYIDANYDLNDQNEDQMENISQLVMECEKKGPGNIKLSLENILKNLQLNLKVWPLDVQNKIDNVWSQIISL
ncbi:hypothetical protein NE865_06798 [Phthorimaea operculella]|nr:hypothetical protein NE865_06798 [Phthorimaea operculella]